MRPGRPIAILLFAAVAIAAFLSRHAAPARAASRSASTAPKPQTHSAPRVAEPQAPPAAAPSTTEFSVAHRCLDLAETDPLAAVELALANKFYETDPGLTAGLMSHWARQDFAGAYEWTKRQEPGAWRDDILARLAFLRAQSDPLAAARIVVSDMSPGPAREEATISVLHQWALRDAEAARLWAESLPADPLRARAVTEVNALRRPVETLQ